MAVKRDAKRRPQRRQQSSNRLTCAQSALVVVAVCSSIMMAFTVWRMPATKASVRVASPSPRLVAQLQAHEQRLSLLEQDMQRLRAAPPASDAAGSGMAEQRHLRAQQPPAAPVVVRPAPAARSAPSPPAAPQPAADAAGIGRPSTASGVPHLPAGVGTPSAAALAALRPAQRIMDEGAKARELTEEEQAAARAGGYMLRAGWYFWTMHLKSVPAKKPLECFAACDAAPLCMGFSFDFKHCRLVKHVKKEMTKDARNKPTRLLVWAALSVSAAKSSELKQLLGQMGELPVAIAGPALTEEHHQQLSFTVYHLNMRYTRYDPSREERLGTLRHLLSVICHSFLEPLGIEHWLTAGTLIGQFRDGAILSWDDDADIALTTDSLAALRSALTRYNPPDDVRLIFRTGLHSDAIPLQFVNATNGVYIDTRLYHRKQPSSWVFPWPYGRGKYTVTDDTLYPLRRCQFEGKAYWCPRRTKQYLRGFYGSLAPPPGKH